MLLLIFSVVLYPIDVTAPWINGPVTLDWKMLLLTFITIGVALLVLLVMMDAATVLEMVTPDRFSVAGPPRFIAF